MTLESRDLLIKRFDEVLRVLPVVKLPVAIGAHGYSVFCAVGTFLRQLSDVMNFKIWAAVGTVERGLLIAAFTDALGRLQDPSLHSGVSFVLRN